MRKAGDPHVKVHVLALAANYRQYLSRERVRTWRSSDGPQRLFLIEYQAVTMDRGDWMSFEHAQIVSLRGACILLELPGNGRWHLLRNMQR